MSWQKHTLCFRLLSPLHIGYRKVGNLMQTRGYVPGKVLWGTLTARLTRDFGNGADGQRYLDIGRRVNEHFRFGYLYLALPKDSKKTIHSPDDLEPYYSWDDNLFDYRFLSSYASTALNYDQHAAAEGLLHETEFIRSWARPLHNNDQPLPVYLMGCVYVQNNLTQELDGWRTALDQIQLGGERGYGWGRLRLDFTHVIDVDPIINLEANNRILAHVQYNKANLVGTVEPLVGWERDNTGKGRKNWRLSSATVCYAPGAICQNSSTFTIGDYGIWQAMI